MTRGPHRLILASAGTGKTYQLTGQFLGLLLGGVPPERILATTFTRKAAGEILDRVLRRLVDAATDESSRAELARQIGDDVPAEELRLLLAALARRLDRFRIRTLDAFFVHVAKLFALDLGLPADWTIAEEVEDEALRRDAVADALAGADRAEWVELLRGLVRADTSRSVERVLLSTVDVGRGAFLDGPPEAWSRIVVPPALEGEELAEARAALESLALPTTKKGDPDKRWVRARDEALAHVDSGDWESFVQKGIAAKLVAGEAEFCRHDIGDDAWAVFAPLLRGAAHHLVGEVSRQNRATLAWLERFEVVYAERKHQERAYRFEDLPQALAPRGEDRLAERRLDMWYRLDGRLDHLLLDEFQDTSPSQWRILERLATELLADGTGTRSFFCVGDVKQSIYGWREAEPRLLAGMADRYPQLDPPEQLSRSWRSSAVVLDTVNRVFGSIGSSEAFSRESYAAAARDWQADFGRHEAERDLAGAAWLLEARPPADGEGERMPVLELAAERVAAIAAEAPHATIGILLRRNDDIAQLIYLLRERGLFASGEGGNPLVDSSAVLHLVSVLHFADHPSDTAAAFHVATSPLSEAVGLRPGADRARIEDAARATRARLADGYGAFCASLVPAVRVGYGAWDRERFDQLVDLAYAFDTRATMRPSLFVDTVRATPVEDPSATQIKVMTIHAAKGLEFDAVVLPELDEAFFPRETSLLTLRPDPAGLLEAVSNAPSREVCALDPDVLAPMRVDQDHRGMREALCLLYVAMTRAAHRLDMIVQHRRRNTVARRYSGILREALGPGPPDGRGVLWEHSDNAPSWFPEPDDAEPAEGSGLDAAAPLRFRPSDAARSLARRTPSAQEGGGRVSATDLLRPRRTAARTRGTLVHRWLEEVEWLETFEWSDDDLFELAASLEPDGELVRGALDEFRTSIAAPTTRGILTRGDRTGDVEVWRERSFSIPLPDVSGEECVWTGSFDRVVIERRDGEPVAAEVIDFKSDRVEGDAIESRLEYYRPQLEAYRRILARMTGLEEKDVAARVLFLAADEVRTV